MRLRKVPLAIDYQDVLDAIAAGGFNRLAGKEPVIEEKGIQFPSGLLRPDCTFSGAPRLADMLCLGFPAKKNRKKRGAAA